MINESISNQKLTVESMLSDLQDNFNAKKNKIQQFENNTQKTAPNMQSEPTKKLVRTNSDKRIETKK